MIDVYVKLAERSYAHFERAGRDAAAALTTTEVASAIVRQLRAARLGQYILSRQLRALGC